MKQNKKMADSTTGGGNPVIDLTGFSSKQRGTTFATNTNFKEKEKTDAAATPGPGKATKEDKLKEVVAQVSIKILPGAKDIQETVLGPMHHCLTVLKERDKMACFVNAT